MQALKTIRKKLRYQQAMDMLEGEIKTGKYLPNSKLPPLTNLSKSMGLNHSTIRKGIEGLEHKGLLRVRPRVGVFVSERPLKNQEPRKKVTRIVLACHKHMLEEGKHHPAITAYLAGAHRQCSTPDYSVQTMFYGEHRFVEDIGEALVSHDVDGVVICDGGTAEQDYEFLASHQIALVHCSRAPKTKSDAVRVTRDMSAALNQVVVHLKSLNHRRIAFVCWSGIGDEGKLHRAFVQLAFDHQLGDPRELLIKMRNADCHSQWEDAEDFFDLDPLPTAVIALDEFIADVLLASCDRRGIKVPNDLSVAALLDLLPYAHRVPLTSPDGVKEVSEKIEVACGALIKLIQNKPIAQRDIQLTPQLVVKASTGPARTLAKQPVSEKTLS